MKSAVIALSWVVLIIPCCVGSVRAGNTGLPVESTWKSLGGDFGRTGLSKHAGPEIGCTKWKFETNGAVSASVSVGAGGRVHIPCEDGRLYALDPNGSLLWSYDANTPLISSPSVGPDGTVYVGGMNGKLHAVVCACA